MATHGRPMTIVLADEAGGNSFITKPASFPGLVDVMKTLDSYCSKVAEIPAGR